MRCGRRTWLVWGVTLAACGRASGSASEGAAGSVAAGGSPGTGDAAGGAASTGGAGSGGFGGAAGGEAGGASGAGVGATGVTSGGAGGTSAGGSGGGTSAAGCPTGLPGPALVNVLAPPGSPVASYCIDATEVTNAQYAAFLAASPRASRQPAECSWNASYAPSSDWPATGRDSYPVAHVDWCDAYAFCKWAGKHLCGKIGGGANAYADYADATRSEWMNACSAGGTRTYPYGSTYSATQCNGYENGVLATVAVGSMATCEGGYAGLFDLGGNVWEWEDSCNGVTGTTDACRLRGGSFADGPDGGLGPALGCETGYDVNRDASVDRYLGFRCCVASF